VNFIVSPNALVSISFSVNVVVTSPTVDFIAVSLSVYLVIPIATIDGIYAVSA
jgi:hypothetical protein